MADNVLKAIITADGREFTKTLKELEDQLKAFEQGMKNTANVESFNRLNRAAEATKQKIGALKGSFENFTKSSGQATIALSNLGRVAQDAPYGFIGIANNLNPLLESFQRLKTETGSTKAALSSLGSSLLGAGGLGIAVSVASSLLVVFGDRLFGASKAAKEAKSSSDELKDSINSAFKNAGKEAAEVNSLITVLKSETETRERKLATIKELQRIQPESFANIKLEGDLVKGLDVAYQSYINNLRQVIKADILRAKLSQLLTKQLEEEGATATGNGKKVFDANKRLLDQALNGELGTNALTEVLKISNDKKKKIANTLNNEIADILSQLSEVTKGVKVDLNVKPGKVKLDYEDPFKNSKLDFNFREPYRLAEMAARELREAVKKELEQPIKPKIKLVIGDDIKDALLSLKGKLKIPELLGDIFGVGKKFDFLDDATANLVTMAQTLQGLLVPAFEGMANAIFEGKNAFQSFFKSLGQGIKQIFAQLAGKAALAGILSLVFPTGLGGAKGFGAIFQNLLGFRAAGGPVSSGGSYIVGERGPELFTPSANGSIIPNGRLSSYGGGSLMGQVQFVISGNNLVGVLSSANRYQGRVR